MDSIIEVNNISKRYDITRHQNGYIAMRDVLADAIRQPMKFLKPKSSNESFWALQNISFNVEKGEALGVIGANGSGKSTLLKVMTRITPPTSGEIKIKGKISSLLEVGTGFHPELSGRENILLNGAILGMSQREIRSKFNEIVSFSGVDRFIDTPVKHYSSGMYVRLAFAVAAHLEPDILLIDEVLAVGDAAFQKKCLGKMDDVIKNSKRTILFVSHNMNAIQSICERSILLDSGKIIAIGNTKDIVNTYLKALEKGIDFDKRHDRKSQGEIRLTSFYVEHKGKKIGVLEPGKNYNFCFGYKSLKNKPLKKTSIWFSIHHEGGLILTHFDTRYTHQDFALLPAKGILKCTVEHFPLVAGAYQISAGIKSGDEVDIFKRIGFIEVGPGNIFGENDIEAHGQVFIKHNWVEN